jgi:outer membrane protein TolC
LAFSAVHPAAAQIEKQAATYDMTMADCLAQTFNQNPELRSLRADIDRAAGTKVVYRSRALPQLSGQIRGGGRQGSLYGSRDLFTTLTAQFSQPLIDIGVPAVWRRGTLEVVLAQQNLNREVTERLHEARTTFLRALFYRDFTRLYEEIDKRLQANVNREQQRLDAGFGNEAALKNAKIQQLNLARDLASLRAEYFTAVTHLVDLCGQDPSGADSGHQELTLPKPTGELQYTQEAVDLTHSTEYALQHRADLKLLQALIEATAADRRAVQAGYFPLVSLTSSGLFIPENALVSKQTSIVHGQDPRTSEYRTGVAVSWRVIDNGQVTGASRRVEAIRQQYELTLHKLEQNIPREFATIEGALEYADARRVALLKSAESAEETLQSIESQVALGQATQFDFLQAQSNLLSVRAGVLDATYAHELARADLDRVAGRYLEFRVETVQPVAAAP